MLPEHLVDHIVSVEVDRGGGDVTFRFTATEHVRAEHHDVTGRDDPLPELTEQ